jgi:hypothetical protein
MGVKVPVQVVPPPDVGVAEEEEEELTVVDFEEIGVDEVFIVVEDVELGADVVVGFEVVDAVPWTHWKYPEPMCQSTYSLFYNLHLNHLQSF